MDGGVVDDAAGVVQQIEIANPVPTEWCASCHTLPTLEEARAWLFARFDWKIHYKANNKMPDPILNARSWYVYKCQSHSNCEAKVTLLNTVLAHYSS